jgi:hypothetical protein
MADESRAIYASGSTEAAEGKLAFHKKDSDNSNWPRMEHKGSSQKLKIQHWKESCYESGKQ